MIRPFPELIKISAPVVCHLVALGILIAFAAVGVALRNHIEVLS